VSKTVPIRVQNRIEFVAESVAVSPRPVATTSRPFRNEPRAHVAVERLRDLAAVSGVIGERFSRAG
jgi:hypothetical protein